jgi:amino acid transporter
MALLEFTIPTCMILGGMAVTDAFNDVGTFGAIGFTVAYVFISLAAPAYLKKLGELRPLDLAVSGAAVILLLGTILFGFFIPPPAPPVNYFPYIFIAYFLLGLVCFVRMKNKPKVEMMLTPPESLIHEVA